MTGSFVYDAFGNIDLNLTAVPETSTWLAVALALCALAYTQRQTLQREDPGSLSRAKGADPNQRRFD